MYLYVHSSPIHSSQIWKQPKCPSTDESIKKTWYIYTMKYYSVITKWNNAICNNMDGTRDYHTKWSKSDREIQISYDITYTWNVKHDTNEPIYEMETDSQTRGGCQGGGEVGEFEVSRSKLVHIEWIQNKVPLSSMGNYSQYFEINHNGKEYFLKKNVYKYIHTYISESLLYGRN